MIIEEEVIGIYPEGTKLPSRLFYEVSRRRVAVVSARRAKGDYTFSTHYENAAGFSFEALFSMISVAQSLGRKLLEESPQDAEKNVDIIQFHYQFDPFGIKRLRKYLSENG